MMNSEYNPSPPLSSEELKDLELTLTQSSPKKNAPSTHAFYLTFSDAEVVGEETVIHFLNATNHYHTILSNEEEGSKKLDYCATKLATHRTLKGKKVSFDNSRTSEYQGCWMNSLYQMFLRIFTKKEWKALIEAVKKIGDKRMEESKHSNNSMIENEEDNLMIRKDILTTFMDIAYALNNPSSYQIQSNILASYISTRKLTEKLACDTIAMKNSGLKVGDLKTQMCCL